MVIQYTYGNHSVDSMNFEQSQNTSSSSEGELGDDFRMILPEDRFRPQLPTIQSIDETVEQQINGHGANGHGAHPHDVEPNGDIE